MEKLYTVVYVQVHVYVIYVQCTKLLQVNKGTIISK